MPAPCPLVLKANSAIGLGSVKDEAITATVRDGEEILAELGRIIADGVGYVVASGSLLPGCQTALKIAPLSASNVDPLRVVS